MMKLILITPFLFVLSINVSAQARYTLVDCYEMAVKNNLTLKKAENEIHAGYLGNQTLKYNRLPALAFRTGHYFSFGKNIDPVTNSFVNESFSGGSMGLSAELNIFSGFQTFYSIKQGKYLVDAAEHAKQRIKIEVLSNITLAYSRVLFAKEQLDMQRSNILRTSRELEIAQEKIKLGKVSRNEALVLNARLHSETADYISIENDSLTAIQDLRSLLNKPYHASIEITPVDTSILVMIRSKSISTSDFIATVLENHPAIKEAIMKEKAISMAVKVARSELYPSFYVGGNLVSNYNANQTTFNGNKIPFKNQVGNNFGQNVYIGASIPFFSQMKFVNNIKKQKLNVSNAQYEIKETENAVVSNSLQLLNEFNSAKRKYAATLAALEENNLSYLIYEEKYKLGLISSLDLVTGKDRLNMANAKYLQSKFELFFRYQLLELVMSDIIM